MPNSYQPCRTVRIGPRSQSRWITLYIGVKQFLSTFLHGRVGRREVPLRLYRHRRVVRRRQRVVGRLEPRQPQVQVGRVDGGGGGGRRGRRRGRSGHLAQPPHAVTEALSQESSQSGIEINFINYVFQINWMKHHETRVLTIATRFLDSIAINNRFMAQSTTTALSWPSMTTRIFNSTMILESINPLGQLSLATLNETYELSKRILKNMIVWTLNYVTSLPWPSSSSAAVCTWAAGRSPPTCRTRKTQNCSSCSACSLSARRPWRKNEFKFEFQKWLLENKVNFNSFWYRDFQKSA